MADIIPGLVMPDALSIMSMISTIIGYLIFFGIMAGIMIFAMKKKWLFKYPISVVIFQMKSGALQFVDTDKARRVKKKGSEKFDFKKRNTTWQPPTYEALVQAKKGSLLFLKELSADDFEIIDPREFVKAMPSDYRRVEKNAMDKYFKNVEDAEADLKWNKENKWQKLIDALPVIIILIGSGLLIYFVMNYGILPVLDRASAVTDASARSLEKATEMLDKSMEYMSATGVIKPVTK